MTAFVTTTIFLCISYILYHELRNIEDTILSIFSLVMLWLLLRTQIPIEWWKTGHYNICFWDLSLGLLIVTATIRMMENICQWVWTKTREQREQFMDLVKHIALEVWQDKLLSFTLISILILYVASMIKIFLNGGTKF